MYLYDFVQTPNRVVSDEKSVSHILYYNVTAENCARLCVQNFGYKCKALSFCGNVTQCIIYSVENLLTAAQTKTSNLCHLYTSKFFNSLPVDKILKLFKWRAFADDEINVT